MGRMRAATWCRAFLGVWVALVCAGADSDDGREGDARDGIRLFDGVGLTGWTTWLVDSGTRDPRRVFTVTNGCLRISGDGLGYIRTRGIHRNYRLVVEYRWGGRNWDWNSRRGRARDSGIFLHARGPDGNSHDGDGAFMAAIECNLFEGATGDFLLIRGDGADGRLIAPRVRVVTRPDPDADGWFWWDPAGTVRELVRWGRVNRRGKPVAWEDRTGFRAPGELEHPAGQWNRVECECDGDRIRVRLNGVTVNEVSRVEPSSGHILLQCEGSEIEFRRVELYPLPTAP